MLRVIKGIKTVLFEYWQQKANEYQYAAESLLDMPDGAFGAARRDIFFALANFYLALSESVE